MTILIAHFWRRKKCNLNPCDDESFGTGGADCTPCTKIDNAEKIECEAAQNSKVLECKQHYAVSDGEKNWLRSGRLQI
jgi:hypothetical protein